MKESMGMGIICFVECMTGEQADLNNSSLLCSIEAIPHCLVPGPGVTQGRGYRFSLQEPDEGSR